MGGPTALVTAVAAVITSPGALLTPAPKMAPFLHFLSAGGVKSQTFRNLYLPIFIKILQGS